MLAVLASMKWIARLVTKPCPLRAMRRLAFGTALRTVGNCRTLSELMNQLMQIRSSVQTDLRFGLPPPVFRLTDLFRLRDHIESED